MVMKEASSPRMVDLLPSFSGKLIVRDFIEAKLNHVKDLSMAAKIDIFLVRHRFLRQDPRG